MAKRRANGEGSIYKRKYGRWEGRYTVGYTHVTTQMQADAAEKIGGFMSQAQG